MSCENCLRSELTLLLAALGALVAEPAAAQDLDAMLKWTEAKVVHYRIAGDATGRMVLQQGVHTVRSAAVTDHIEFEFDWDNQAMVILGNPVLRNTPMKFAANDATPLEMGACPPARVEGVPEFASVTRVTAMSVLLEIEFKQQTAGGAIPWDGGRAEGKCGDAWDPASPSTETLTVQLQLPPGMMLAMPPEQSGYDLSKDGKSFLPKPENGWSWVITPSIVK
jgi:hypothetical protein